MTSSSGEFLRQLQRGWQVVYKTMKCTASSWSSLHGQGRVKSQKPSLHSPIPCPREKRFITFIRFQLTLQHELVGRRREPGMGLDASFPSATAKPGFQDNLCLGAVRIRFADAETLE